MLIRNIDIYDNFYLINKKITSVYIFIFLNEININIFYFLII
jgi:hypothetical protein